MADEANRERDLHRTLVVGLGGTGHEVCTYLKKVLLEENQFDRDRTAHVKLLSIDTDEGAAIQENSLAIGGTQAVELLPHEERMVVDLPDGLDLSRFEWFPADLLRRQAMDSRGKGAGRYRAIGRLFLAANWSRVYREVAQLLNDLQKKEIADTLSWARDNEVQLAKETQVFVVGNLVSGTCSGMFLEFGYLLRQVMGVGRMRIIGLFTIAKHNQYTVARKAANCMQRCANWTTTPEIGSIRPPSCAGIPDIGATRT